MARIDRRMSILDLERMPSLPAKPVKRPSFVSTQVADAQRYYLNLNARGGAGITVVCGGRERVQSDYEVRRETFPFYAVEFVAEGEGTLDLNGVTHRLRPGMAFSYGPGADHRIRTDPSRPMLKYYVDFTGADSRRLLAESPLRGWKAVQISSPEEVAGIFEMLQREGASDSPLRVRFCAALVPLLIMKITERAVPYGGIIWE
jgi:hypothetical protein